MKKIWMANDNDVLIISASAKPHRQPAGPWLQPCDPSTAHIRKSYEACGQYTAGPEYRQKPI